MSPPGGCRKNFCIWESEYIQGPQKQLAGLVAPSCIAADLKVLSTPRTAALQSINHISLHMDVKERTLFLNRAEQTTSPGRNLFSHPLERMVGLIGLEPMTPALSRRCSNQLSYRPRGVPLARNVEFFMLDVEFKIQHSSFKIAPKALVEVTGFEPMTFCLQSRRSTN